MACGSVTSGSNESVTSLLQKVGVVVMVVPYLQSDLLAATGRSARDGVKNSNAGQKMPRERSKDFALSLIYR
jgi:hypothetical protein